MVNIDDKRQSKVTNLPVQQDLRKSPTNLEAERSLLGAILSNNKADPVLHWPSSPSS